jgi:hypothetical protein
MPSRNPGRPPNVQDTVTQLNGCPMFPVSTPDAPLGTNPASGILTSTGAAVNNVTTATPFATGTPNADGVTRTLLGSMAGRVYLVHAVAAGFLMPSSSALVNDMRAPTVAGTGTIPPLAGSFPGVPLQAGDVRELIMLQTTGWLQWISATGTASLVVWELF